MIKSIDDSSFAEEIFTSTKPCCIKFYAPWCDSCQEFEEEYKQLSEEYNMINFFEINCDDSYILPDKFQIHKLPSFVLIKNREIDNVIAGVVPAFRSILNNYK